MPSAAFESAAVEIKQLTTSPSNDNLLKLYGLFKQATVGDNTTSKPTFDIKGRYKWDAWTELKGLSSQEAEDKYIALVKELTSQ
ncbi:acyl-CoA-binding protein [Spinellus fusiger]|nr:acyl-CoA-binding protein [Spinellus fusiger]